MGVIVSPKWVPLWHVPLFIGNSHMVGLLPVVAPTKEGAWNVAGLYIDSPQGREEQGLVYLGRPFKSGREVIVDGD